LKKARGLDSPEKAPSPEKNDDNMSVMTAATEADNWK